MPGLRRRDVLTGGAGACALAAWAPTSAQDETPLYRQHTGDLGALATVDAELGGRRWRCLLDSGASVSVVSPEVARRDGLRVVDRTRVATAGGTMVLERVELPPVRLADRHLDMGEALVLDLAAQLGDAGAGVEGLIGAPALRAQRTRLDLAAGRLRWASGNSPPPGPHAVWPLRWDQGLPVIELALGDRDPEPFMFDTGNAGALVVFAHRAAELAAHARGLPSVTMRELGGDVTVHQALVERLRAPGYAGREIPVAFEAGAAARRGAHFDRLSGSAGLALFGAGAVTLDGPGGRLTVELPGLPEPTPLPGGFGFALQAAAGASPEVIAVFAGGPAERAGVRPGMRLRTIDGAAVGGAASAWRRLAGVEQAAFRFDPLASPVALARERFFERWR